jgi:excisionase family DNA binding protein
MDGPEGPEPYVDMKAVAAFLGSTERHVRDLVYRRAIPFYKVGRLVRFRLSEVEAWVQASREATDPPP